MHTFNESFNAEQSGAHPKGVQVTHLAAIGSLLGSPLASPQSVYMDPKV